MILLIRSCIYLCVCVFVCVCVCVRERERERERERDVQYVRTMSVWVFTVSYMGIC